MVPSVAMVVKPGAAGVELLCPWKGYMEGLLDLGLQAW